MTKQQTAYDWAIQLGLGCTLTAVAIGSLQVGQLAGIRYQADMKKAQLESTTQIAEKQAEGKGRELEALAQADSMQMSSTRILTWNRDQPFPKGFEKGLQPNETTLIYDQWQRCAGIWRNGKLTKNYTICNQEIQKK